VMEEQWLYEAITGTYLPLLQTFEGLVRDGIPFRCTVSLSAPLITMLTDDLLKERYAAHLDKLIELSEREMERTKPEPHYRRLAQMYRDRFGTIRHTWRCHDGDLVRAFRGLQEAGRVEVITSTATHAFFPLLDRNWAALRAQVHVAADLYERHFGARPIRLALFSPVLPALLLNYFKAGTYEQNIATEYGRRVFERVGCTTCGSRKPSATGTPRTRLIARGR